jgi:hypothetical protein
MQQYLLRRSLFRQQQMQQRYQFNGRLGLENRDVDRRAIVWKPSSWMVQSAGTGVGLTDVMRGIHIGELFKIISFDL